MKILGFNFTKIHAERASSGNLSDLKINSNIDISEIKEVKSELFKSKETMTNIKFSYDIGYEPDFAKISFEGNLVLSMDSRTSSEILRKWKSQELPENFRVTLFNIILKKASLRALQIEEEFNLPYHLPLPNVKLRKEEEQ